MTFFFAGVVGSFHPKRTPIGVVTLNARVEIRCCATTALHALLPIHPSICLLLHPANHRIRCIPRDDLGVMQHVELLRRIATGIE